MTATPTPQTLASSAGLAAREHAVAHAESELTARESELRARADHLEATATAFAGRVDALWRQMAALSRGADVPALQEAQRRLEALHPAPLSVRAERERAIQVREQAARARAEVAEACRQQVEGMAAWMAQAQKQLAAEEAQLRKIAVAMEERRREEAERARQAEQAKLAERARRAVPEAQVEVTPDRAPELSPEPPTPVAFPTFPGEREVRPRPARARMQAQVDFESDSNFYSGFSTNIGEGGLFVATVNLLPPGTPVDVRFTLPGGVKVDTHAVVRWVREINDAAPEIFPGVGVQFVELPDSARAAIHQFVAAREPLFFPEPT